MTQTKHPPAWEKQLRSAERRKKHYHTKRAIADAFEKFNMQVMADRLRACNEQEIAICCDHCGDHFWTVEHCRNRVCPLCSWDVQMDRQTYVLKKLKTTKHPKLLTLTMSRWRGDPRAGIDHLRKAFNTLRKRKLFRFCAGGSYTIELKPKNDGWHIHIHVLMDAPYIPRQKIFSAWKQILDVPYASVDLRAAKSGKQKAYVTKYACKGVVADAGIDAIVDWYLAVKGKRLWGTFGSWFERKQQDDPDAEETISIGAPCPMCKERGMLFPYACGPFIYRDEWDDYKGRYADAWPGWRSIEPVADLLESPG